MVPVWVTFSYTYNGWPIESRIWSIERRHFQWPWTTPTPSFKVTPFFDTEYIISGTTYRHSFNEILIETLHTPYSTMLFCMTLSELEWLSKIFNDTKRERSLCDSWASCYRASAYWSTILISQFCPSVRHTPVFYGNSFTYWCSFFTTR